jgi:hypothetical protein
MSTRCSIKFREQDGDTPGFHLWEEAFEKLDHGDNAPVYLRLDGVQVSDLERIPGGGVSVCVVLPREMAIALGLVAQQEGK